MPLNPANPNLPIANPGSTIPASAGLTLFGGTALEPFFTAPAMPQELAAQPNSLQPLQQNQPSAVTTVYESSRYGDMVIQTVVFAAIGCILVLPRPSGIRTYLLIENLLAAPNQIRVNFDNPASANSGIGIDSSGSWLFDSVVPQNNVYIFAPAAGSVQIAWINVNITLG